MIFKFSTKLKNHISRFLILFHVDCFIIKLHFSLFINRFTIRFWNLYIKKSSLWFRSRFFKTVSKFISATLLKSLTKNVLMNSIMLFNFDHDVRAKSFTYEWKVYRFWKTLNKHSLMTRDWLEMTFELKFIVDNVQNNITLRTKNAAKLKS